MNEVDLIKEVEKHPILYDKSVSGFNKTKLRDEAWKEVQDALHVSGMCPSAHRLHRIFLGLSDVGNQEDCNPTFLTDFKKGGGSQLEESECKKRWRSLRDSFIKLQRTHGGRTRWPYHQAMRFLLPHLDIKQDTTTKREEDSDQEEEIRHRPIPTNSLPDLSFPDPCRYEEEDESQPSPKKMRQNSMEEESSCQCNRTDPDELFLLSCAPILKRLNSKQNAVARLKIQQVLYEAEFGCQMDLPYVTPASDCGFDNIEGHVA